MTDEEMVKVMEACKDKEMPCDDCPLVEYGDCEEISLQFFYDRFKQLKAENADLRERLEKAVELPFIVIDKKTGKEADEYEIALHEDWAKHLMYCDMEGFAIEQDGTLILLDECGQFVYCSSDRFEVVPEASLAELKGEEKNG